MESTEKTIGSLASELGGLEAEIVWGRSENEIFYFDPTPAGVRALCRELMKHTSYVGDEVYYPAFWSYGESGGSASTSTRGPSRRSLVARHACCMAQRAAREAIDEFNDDCDGDDEISPDVLDNMIASTIDAWCGNG
jgi:hypothetical protein